MNTAPNKTVDLKPKQQNHSKAHLHVLVGYEAVEKAITSLIKVDALIDHVTIGKEPTPVIWLATKPRFKTMPSYNYRSIIKTGVRHRECTAIINNCRVRWTELDK